MALYHLLGRNLSVGYSANLFKILGYSRTLLADFFAKTQLKFLTTDSLTFNPKLPPLPSTHHSHEQLQPKSFPPKINSAPSSQPTQIYNLVRENHPNLDTLKLLKCAEALQDSGLSDQTVIKVLSERLLLDLEKVTTPKLMSRFLRVLEPSAYLSEDLLEKVVTHIFRNKLYPYMGSTRVWTTYFKFLGDNRIFHQKLYQELGSLYLKYVEWYTSEIGNNTSPIPNESDNSTEKEHNDHIGCNKPPLNNRFQNSLATVCWCLSVCGIRNEELFDRVLRIINFFAINPAILIRIYWSLSILGTRLNSINLETLGHLLKNETSSNSLYKQSHINQIYHILKSMELNQNPNVSNHDCDQIKNTNCNINRMIEQCKNNLIKFGYGKNGKIISKSQKLVSDFLIRCNIPHQLEVLTEDLISIDISIRLGDERIALEVDGPTHFLRNIEDPQDVRRTGPCLFKENLLQRSGWKYISIPPFNSKGEGEDYNIRQFDEFYRRLLLTSTSQRLREILSKPNNAVHF